MTLKEQEQQLHKRQQINESIGAVKNLMERIEQLDPTAKKEDLKEFQNNQNYTHFAVNKETGKIVNGWDYSDVDSSDLRQFKNDYFIQDLKDYDLDPKNYKILTGAKLRRSGTDPDDNNNWANQ